MLTNTKNSNLTARYRSPFNGQRLNIPRYTSNKRDKLADPWNQTLHDLRTGNLVPQQEQKTQQLTPQLTQQLTPQLTQRLSPPITQIHGATTPGYKKSASTTEDAHTYFTTPECTVSVVADGHGGTDENPTGRAVAQFSVSSVKEFTQMISPQLATMTPEELEHSIKKFFIELDEASRVLLRNMEHGNTIDAQGVVRNFYGHPIHGGSTLSCVWVFMRDGQRVAHVANVGDSEVYLLKRHKISGVVSYQELSTTHEPSSQTEFLRIHNSDLPVKLKLCYKQRNPQTSRSSLFPEIFDATLEGDDLRVREFARNPWGNGLTPSTVRYDISTYAISPPGSRGVQVAMTRCIGDFYGKDMGLIPVPSQQTIILDTSDNTSDEYDKLLVNASDGVWDCHKYQEFAEMMFAKLDTMPTLAECVESMVVDTKAIALAKFGGAPGVDDITLVCMQI